MGRKTTVRRCQAINERNLTRENLDKNAIKTKYVKARIDKTQQNSQCRLCSDINEIINQIISECSKLAQKEYKTRHDWVGRVIHWELCKEFKFDHTNKWYTHNPGKCPWCNGYRCRKWIQHEFKSWTRLNVFHIALIPLGKVWIQLLSLQLWINSRTDWVLQPWWGN